MLNNLACLFSLVALAAIAARAQRSLAATPPPFLVEAKASPFLLKASSIVGFTQPSLTSDWYYLAAISHFGRRSTHPEDYLSLTPLLQQSIAWDPYHVGPYVVAGTALNLRGMDNEAGLRMLTQGTRHLPKMWQLHFLLGTHRYLRNPSDHAAAVSLAAAAKLPGSPSYLGSLAARIAVDAGDPGLGLELLEALGRETQDLELQEIYAKRAHHLRQPAATNTKLNRP